ncbi:UNVERIFIED_CONTAM: hypothetical protein FKN15_062083 [Acipenser sinensis]
MRLVKEALEHVVSPDSVVSVPPAPKAARARRRRRVWCHHRSSLWWEEVVLGPSFTDEQWVETFRVTRATFEIIVELVRADMEPSAHFVVCAPIPLQKRVAIAFFKLAFAVDHKMVGDKYACTVHVYLYKFCRSFVGHLNRFIDLPEEGEARKIAMHVLERYGLPQVMGIRDAIHIPTA